MPITPADIALLAIIAHYYCLTREQVQRLIFPHHKSGRATRKRLGKLRGHELINKHSLPVSFKDEIPAPVYYLTAKGAELLASYFDDEAYLAANTKTPRADRLPHWIALNESRITIETVAKAYPTIGLSGWINEWETINKTAEKRERFCLHTQITETPPLSCSPDAAFLLTVAGHSKVFYVEQDRGTSSPRQIAARKMRGYSELESRQLHRNHYPNTTFSTFSVLLITTHERRRDAVQKAIVKNAGKELWRFIAQADLEKLFEEAVILDDCGDLAPLVKPEFLRPSALPNATAGEEVAS